MIDLDSILTMLSFVSIAFLLSKEGRMGITKVSEVFTKMNQEINGMLGLAISTRFEKPEVDEAPKPDFLDSKFGEINIMLEENFRKIFMRLDDQDEKIARLEGGEK